MKFFWKVFFSTITVTVLMFSFCGYILINTMFTTSLQNEIARAKEENDILRIILKDSVVRIPHNGELTMETLQPYMEKFDISTSSGSLQIRISDQNYNRIYENRKLILESPILKKISSTLGGYEIIETNGFYFIDIAYPIQFDKQTIYLENFREVTSIFTQKERQYVIFQKLMGVLILVNGLILFLISMWLTLPIKKLSNATKLMANGDFSKRVNIKNKDEIGMLSKDFNVMGSKLEQSVTEIKESARRQEDFVASFGHELKTPLTSIIGYADVLRSKKLSEEQSFTYSNYIFTEGKRLETLSHKLMEMVILKKQTFPMKKIQANTLFDRIKDVMQSALEEENIKFVVSAEQAELIVEPDLMKTVLINLIDNSKKAIQKNGTIHLTGLDSDDYYEISVLDDGKGIPNDEISKITEAFYMVDKSRSRAEGGVGLGLSICSDIIKLHNAQMEIKSTLSQGTQITIFLKKGEQNAI